MRKSYTMIKIETLQMQIRELLDLLYVFMILVFGTSLIRTVALFGSEPFILWYLDAVVMVFSFYMMRQLRKLSGF